MAPDLAALVEDSAARAHAATHPDLDAEDAAVEADERAALAAEAEPPEPAGLTAEYLAGLARAAGAEPDPWPELATLSAACHTAIRPTRDGGTETRHRLPDGTWGPPEREPAPARTCPPVVIGSAPPPPGSVCTACGGRQWWRSTGPRATTWRCRGCHPVASLAGLRVAP